LRARYLDVDVPHLLLFLAALDYCDSVPALNRDLLAVKVEGALRRAPSQVNPARDKAFRNLLLDLGLDLCLQVAAGRGDCQRSEGCDHHETPEQSHGASLTRSLTAVKRLSTLTPVGMERRTQLAVAWATGLRLSVPALFTSG